MVNDIEKTKLYRIDIEKQRDEYNDAVYAHHRGLGFNPDREKGDKLYTIRAITYERGVRTDERRAVLHLE